MRLIFPCLPLLPVPRVCPQALQRLSEPGVTELILPDCSRIEPDQMRASLLQCRSSLRVLRLGTCGRCFGDETLKALVAVGGLPRLEMAALAGEVVGRKEGRKEEKQQKGEGVLCSVYCVDSVAVVVVSSRWLL